MEGLLMDRENVLVISVAAVIITHMLCKTTIYIFGK